MIKLHRNALDAHLFLVRHLLILKDLVNKLDLVQKEAEKVVEPPGVTGGDNPFSKSLFSLTCEVRRISYYAEQDDILIP